MSRTLYALIVLLLVSIALAAPVPPPFTAGWDNPVVPDRDCKIIRAKGALTIEMPGSDHDYDPQRERKNAPRLLRDVEGDFVIRVHIHIDCHPSSKSTVEGQLSSVAAGFLLIPPKSSPFTCIRFEFGVAAEGIGADGYAGMKHRDIKKGRMNGIWSRRWGKHWPLPEKANQAYLRWERRGEYFSPSISADGEKWTPLMGPMGFGSLPAKLKVGLAAYSTSTERSKVRFDKFKLIQNRKKKR